MPSFLARLLHSFLGDWATKDRKASNVTAYPVRYRIACDAIDWAFDGGRPPFTAWAAHGSQAHNFTDPNTLVTLFKTSERTYRYIMPPDLANYTGELYLEARGSPFIGIAWTRANPRPMDQCDDPGLFQTMSVEDVSTQTRTYTSKESTVTSVNTVIFTETNQTARPIELPPPPFTSLPEAPTPTIRPPLVSDDSPDTNPTRPTGTQSLQAQPTPSPQAGAQENSPSGINTEAGSILSTLSTLYIDGTGTIQGSGSSESPSVNNLPYVNGSRKNDNKTAFQISTPAGVIIGITAGLVIAGLIAFAVYRYRSSRRRAGFSSQEKLISSP